MYRITSLFLNTTIKKYSCSMRFFSSKAKLIKNKDADLLLKVADDFMECGKVRTAEDLYSTMMDRYPNYQVPYQKLWESWVTHRSLKVTKGELENFMIKYKKNIQGNQQDVSAQNKRL